MKKDTMREFAEFYPDRYKGLICGIESDLRSLKENEKFKSAEIESVMSDLSLLKARCIAFDMQIKLLEEMGWIFARLEEGTLSSEDGAFDMALKACEVLKRHFTGKSGLAVAEKEFERLILNMWSLRTGKTRFNTRPLKGI
jgi:hypothetical protein